MAAKVLTPQQGKVVFYAGMLAPLALVLFLAPFALIKAFVLTKLWAWYVVGTFGLPPLSMPQAYGLSLLATLLTNSASSKKYDDTSTALLFGITVPLAGLFFGWIGTLFL